MQKYDELQGKRLKWIRQKLDLKSSYVYEQCGIPRSTFFDKEKGTQNFHINNLLANFYNFKWSKKFVDNYPFYNGNEIKIITLNFIVYGKDHLQDYFDKQAQILTENFKEKEKQYLEKINQYKSELMKLKR